MTSGDRGSSVDASAIWRAALDRLEVADDDGARELLARAGPSGGSSDRLTDLLSVYLAGGEAGAGPAHGADRIAQDDRDSTEGDAYIERLERVLHHLACARRAVEEWRLDDIVSESSAAAALIQAPGWEEVGWIAPSLMTASLLQVGYRFTGRPDLHDMGVALCEAAANRTDPPHMAVRARATLATYHVVSGHFHRMLDVCDAAIELARATGLETHSVTAMAHQFRGYALFEWNRLDEARAALEEAWRLAGPNARGVRSGVARTLAAVTSALGDAPASDAWVAELEAIVSEPMSLRNREWLAAVRILHDQGSAPDLRTIDAWSRRYDYPTHDFVDVSDDEAASRLHEYEHLLTLLEAVSQWQPVLRVAEAMSRGAPNRPWYAVRADAARAVALEALGRSREADASWSRALGRGEQGGFVRAFVGGSRLRLALLQRALERDPDRHAAERVCAAAGLSATVRPKLTHRQAEVLGRVAEGGSNREVAQALGLSETTVRTHLRAVFERLGVASRTQAVAEARRRGIL